MNRPTKTRANNPVGHNQHSHGDIYNPLTLRKAKAVVMLERGASVRQVQAATGLARQTVTNLRHGQYQVPASMIDALRAEEEAKFTVAAHRILDTLADPAASDEVIEKATLVQRATAVGILFDKARLVRGEPTSITHELKTMPLEELIGRANALRRQLFGADAPQMYFRGRIPLSDSSRESHDDA
jgi:hypothetical protein